jgi:hypothetical protein
LYGWSRCIAVIVVSCFFRHLDAWVAEAAAAAAAAAAMALKRYNRTASVAIPKPVDGQDITTLTKGLRKRKRASSHMFNQREKKCLGEKAIQGHQDTTGEH